MLGEMDLVDRLRGIVGADHVLVDDDLRAGYETDWTGRWAGTSKAVVRPGSTPEVAAVLRACGEDGVAVIPQGGNTGLVGGSVPRSERPPGSQIVLSTRRFDALGEVDARAMQVTAGAGVTIGAWRAHARSCGLDAGVDFAARDTATIGGAIATNAGGSRVLRFGTMRRQLAGIEAVLPTGDVVGSLAGLPKETAGIHWPSLLCGSEGTLGVVTRARLRLIPHFPETATAMVGAASVDDAVELLAALRSGVADLDAVELITPEALDLVSAHIGADPPVVPPADGVLLLIDCAGHRDPSDDLLAVLGSSPHVVGTAIASDPSRRARLLDFRDRITEAIAATATALGSPTFKLDVAVPVTHLAELMHTAREAAVADGCRIIPFGHLAEGNVHLNHLGVRDPEQLAATVLGRVAELGGTISAEHGIGVAKARWLPLIRSRAELDAQRRLAEALDPLRIMNPGVLAP
jgi:FAD/FMN-containing dehydrogenase